MFDSIKTDEEIAAVIAYCCQVGNNPQLAEKIEVCFVPSKETSEKLTDIRFKPSPKILINKSAWMEADDKDKLFALKSESCYLLACTSFNRRVKRDGPEWRYFAFETKTIEVDDSEPEEIESFIILSTW